MFFGDVGKPEAGAIREGEEAFPLCPFFALAEIVSHVQPVNGLHDIERFCHSALVQDVAPDILHCLPTRPVAFFVEA